jgi:hypothetical protein
MYVTVKVSDGFGNQMFMVAAMLGYAERYGHQPVFLEEPTVSKDHSSSSLFIRDFFPQIPVRPDLRSQAWTVLREPAAAAMTFLDLPDISGNVYLQGYFQSERYFPRQGISTTPPVPLNPCAELFAQDWSRTFFLHIRRGDYLHAANQHHQIKVESYLRKSLLQYPTELTCFVVSDDIEWCQQTLPTWFSRSFVFCPATTDSETLFWMSLCAGGICANSSFSWWGAYFQKRGSRVCMPTPWGTPPLPEARDLIPAWATSVSWL